MHLIVPAGVSRKAEMPPQWRINVLLQTLTTIADRNADGSHLAVIFFRHSIFDAPINDIVRPMVEQLRWSQLAKDFWW